MTKKKRGSVGQSIGGILAGIDGQIFRTTPPANELVAKGDPIPGVAAAGGGRLSVDLPGSPSAPGRSPDRLSLSADGCSATVDLVAGGRLASLNVGGHELLRTTDAGLYGWGSFPMAPYAGRIRDASFTFEGERYALPVVDPPHAMHGTTYDRPWQLVGPDSIATDLGPGWPFRGRVTQRFELAPDHLRCRMELHADEPMPASIGWHPWFVRRLEGAPAGSDLELGFDAGAMYRRDAAGIATAELVPPPAGPWDDCFTDLRQSPTLRWPGILGLTIESDCPAWVVFTFPEDALCVEPQTAPPDALNVHPTVVQPGRPLIAEMTWRWWSLAD